MFRSIRKRLIASYILLTVFTVAITGVLGIGLVQRYAMLQEREYLNANAQAIAGQAVSFMDMPGSRLSLLRLTQSAAFLGDLDVRIFDTRNQLLADSSLGATEVAWHAPTTGETTGAESELGLDAATLGITDGDSGPVLIFTVDMSQLADAHEARLPLGRENEWRQQGRIRGPGITAADESEANIITIRRSPSFWGHRLSFEPVPALAAVHHGQMGGQVNPPATLTAAQQVTMTTGPSTVALVPAVGLRTEVTAGTTPTARWDFTSHTMNHQAIAPIADAEGQYGFVAVSRTASLQAEPLAALRRVFLIAAAGAIGLASVLGWGVSRGLTSPIQSLVQAAEQMEAGDLAARAPVHSPDELGALARQFNSMARQLQSSFDALQQERDTLRRFVADASHELRTPMTALRTFTELLQGSAGNDAATRAEFLRESANQVARLEWITRNLLDLSRLDAGVAQLEMARYDVTELVEAAVAPFRARALGQNIVLSINLPPSPPELICDQARIEMALGNLIDNSLKFTPAGGKVEIGVETTVENDNQALRLWVEDTGPGIDPEDAPHIFARFYRSPRVRQEGSGLGLAIVQSIAQAHGGQVRLAAASNPGSRFEIILPLRPPAQDVPPA